MLLSPYSFFASFIAITLLTFLLLIFLKSDLFISCIGIKCMYLFTLLILFRGLLPVEFSSFPFHLTRTIYSRKVFPILRDFLLSPFYETGFMSMTPAAVLAGVWLIGSLIVLGIKVYGYCRCRKMVRLFSEITDPAVTAIFQSAQESIFPKGNIGFRLIQSNRFPTPALWGFRNPVVLLPDIDYTEEELYCVFLHELLHYKQKHFLSKVLLDLLIVIQWWNPVLIFCLLPAVHQIQELSADAQLIRTSAKSRKAAYMTSLAKTLRYAAAKGRFPKGLNFTLLPSHREADILRRFQYIKSIPLKQGSKWGIPFCLLLFILSFTFVFETSYPMHRDEIGDELFRNSEAGTFYIRNDGMYDLYIDNQYVYTNIEILDTFKEIPIYDQAKEEQVS